MTKTSAKKKYIPLACSGMISIRICAEKTGLSMRQVCRLKATWRKRGDNAFINGHKGMRPKNLLFTKEVRRNIVNTYFRLWRGSPFAGYHDFLLATGWRISYTTLSKIMRGAGVVSPGRHKNRRRKHPRRTERARTGELVQMDASCHDWFLNGSRYTIHGAVDDATHRILGLWMCRNECRLGYNEVMRQILTQYGVPKACYTDRHASFVSHTRKKGKTTEELVDYNRQSITHWNGLFRVLGMESILALSPQGKGRIERLWQTLQGRLPFIFRYKGIRTPERANAFFTAFVAAFNARFAVSPQNRRTAFSPVPAGINLEHLLSVKVRRRTEENGLFMFHGYTFRLCAEHPAFRDFTLCLSEQSGIFALSGGKYYPVRLADTLGSGADSMPEVEKDLVRRYLLADIHRAAG